jgi:hypothetical protein
VKTFLLAAVAALGLGLGFMPQEASARWVTRTSYRWDPCCCRYVPYTERYWVPDCGGYDPCDGPFYRDPYRDRRYYDRPDYDRFGRDFPSGGRRLPFGR